MPLIPRNANNIIHDWLEIDPRISIQTLLQFLQLGYSPNLSQNKTEGDLMCLYKIIEEAQNQTTLQMSYCAILQFVRTNLDQEDKNVFWNNTQDDWENLILVPLKHFLKTLKEEFSWSQIFTLNTLLKLLNEIIAEERCAEMQYHPSSLHTTIRTYADQKFCNFTKLAFEILGQLCFENFSKLDDPNNKIHHKKALLISSRYEILEIIKNVSYLLELQSTKLEWIVYGFNDLPSKNDKIFFLSNLSLKKQQTLYILDYILVKNYLVSRIEKNLSDLQPSVFKLIEYYFKLRPIPHKLRSQDYKMFSDYCILIVIMTYIILILKDQDVNIIEKIQENINILVRDIRIFSKILLLESDKEEILIMSNQLSFCCGQI